MLSVTQNKMLANTFWPTTLTVADKEVTIDGRNPVFLWWSRPYQHVLPYRQVSSIQLDKGVTASTIRIQMTGSAHYEIKALPHVEAAKAVELIRAKIA